MNVFIININIIFIYPFQIMDEFANNPAMEFGAVNITGFRLVQNNSRAYEEVFTEKSRYQWPDPKTKKVTVSKLLQTIYLK